MLNIKKLALIVISLVILSTITLGYANPTNFWHLNIGNYLNASEATQELKRLESLNFQGTIIEVVENDISFQQLRIGCYLNEATATRALTQLSLNLRYPSLSKVELASQPSISPCLGIDTGLELPNSLHIIEQDAVFDNVFKDIFVVSIKLLDYERFVTFDGSDWQVLQNKEDFVTNDLEPSQLPLTCSNETSNGPITCHFGDQIIVSELDGSLLWQSTNGAVFQVGTQLKSIKVLSF